MKLGIVSDEVSQDLQQAVEWAKNTQINRFELRNVWGKRLPDITNDEVAKIKSILDKSGIVITGISPGTYKCGLRAEEFSIQRNRFRKTVEIAIALNTNKIISFGIKRSREDSSDDYERVLEELYSIGVIAKEYGMLLCLENEPGFFNDTTDNILKIHRELICVGIKLNWDMGNLFNCSEKNYKTPYETLKDFIGSVHMKDYITVNGGSKCVSLGMGEIDWKNQICDFIHDDLRNEDTEVDMHIETHCEPQMESSRLSYEYIMKTLK